ncbi:MAG: FtsX-like permease family protein [Candidatus Pacearchaeota archaeon]
MISKENIKYVLRNLKRRKIRTFLTSLSILIGVTTIFVFVSFGLGLYSYINQLASSSSADKLVVQPRGFGATGLFNRNVQLTEKDVKLIERIPGVKEVSPLKFGVAEILQGNEKKFSFILGYEPEKPLIFEVSSIEIEKGRFLQKGEKKKALLGYNFMLENKIFPKKYEINQKIKINGEEMQVVGFLKEVGNPQDDSQIYITLDYFNDLFPNTTGFGWIIVKSNLNQVDFIKEKIEDSLRREKGQKKGEETFFVQTFDDLIKTYTSVLNIIIGFVILIALVSVLVSAINTSNTMITSVLERYKEIGVMKSIGARNLEILSIFLFESAFIGFIAGIFGVFFGWSLSYLGGRILASLGWSFLKPFFSFWLFFGCILFATFTGAISGFIPALRASKINPVDALRYE